MVPPTGAAEGRSDSPPPPNAPPAEPAPIEIVDVAPDLDSRPAGREAEDWENPAPADWERIPLFDGGLTARLLRRQSLAPGLAPTPPIPLAASPIAGPSPDPGRDEAPVDGEVAQAACASCGHVHLAGPGPCGSACGNGRCVPGRKPGSAFVPHSHLGRFFANLYECLCCPDPCYQPGWIPQANAAFFLDSPRPRTYTRFRFEADWDMQFPDRAEYFWARDDGKGRGPQPPHSFPKSPTARFPNPIKYRGEGSLNYDQLSMYIETASSNNKASFFVEIPYRSTNPLYTAHHAGFSDMNLGTKTALLDCELLLVTLQFKTFLPIGDSTKGLGTGHVSLEPSLLAALKLSTETYIQGQIAEWIPIGGDPNYEGAILHYHSSLNHVLYRITPQDFADHRDDRIQRLDVPGRGLHRPDPRPAEGDRDVLLQPRAGPAVLDLQLVRLRRGDRLPAERPALGEPDAQSRVPRPLLSSPRFAPAGHCRATARLVSSIDEPLRRGRETQRWPRPTPSCSKS